MDKRWKGAHSAHDEELLFFLKGRISVSVFFFVNFYVKVKKHPRTKERWETIRWTICATGKTCECDASCCHKESITQNKKSTKRHEEKVWVQAEAKAQPTALIWRKTLLIKLELLKLQSETSFQSVLHFCKAADRVWLIHYFKWGNCKSFLVHLMRRCLHCQSWD